MITWVLIIVGMVACVVVFMAVANRALRAMRVGVPLERVFSHYVSGPLPHGRDGSSVMVLHQASGILIQIRKRLLPKLKGRHCMVRLWVQKKRAAKPRWSPDALKARLLSYTLAIGPDTARHTPFWCLPSPDAGEVLAEFDCGSSVAKVRTSLHEIISAEPGIGENPVFDVWAERCTVGLRFGVLDDEPSEGPGAERKPVVTDADQTVLDGQLQWYVCRTDCSGDITEEQGVGIPPAEVHDFLMKKNGAWELCIRPGESPTRVSQIRLFFRKALAAPLGDMQFMFSRIGPGRVYLGTKTEVEWLRDQLAAKKIDVACEPAE